MVFALVNFSRKESHQHSKTITDILLHQDLALYLATALHLEERVLALTIPSDSGHLLVKTTLP